MSPKDIHIKRGDIVFADLSPVIGSEQGGVRPLLVIQNNIGNFMSPTTIVASITKSKTKAIIPTHYYIGTANGLLSEESMVLFEQIRTIDKSRILRNVGNLSLNKEQISEIEKCISVSIGNFSYENNFENINECNQNYNNDYDCDCDCDFDYTTGKEFKSFFEKSLIDIEEECTFLCTDIPKKQNNILENENILEEKTKFNSICIVDDIDD